MLKELLISAKQLHRTQLEGVPDAERDVFLKSFSAKYDL